MTDPQTQIAPNLQPSLALQPPWGGSWSHTTPALDSLGKPS